MGCNVAQTTATEPRSGVYLVKAYLYLRFSTKRQRKGNSARRQTKWAQRWCDRKGITLDESLTIADPGVSGFRGKHRKTGGLSLFLEACRTGRAERGFYLIVENIDCL